MNVNENQFLYRMKDKWAMLQDLLTSAKLPPGPLEFALEAGNKIRNSITKLSQFSTPPAISVFEALNGILVNKSLGIIVQLGIPDLLHSGPATAESLAEKTNTHAPSLSRLLQTLVSLGFLSSSGNEFKNNSFSDILREEHPETMRWAVLVMSSDWYWEIWNRAPGTIETGKSGTEQWKGLSFFDFIKSNPTASEHFNKAMAAYSSVSTPFLLSGFDFSPYSKICDIGGGTGTVLMEILEKYPLTQGVVLDLPEVIEEAKTEIKNKESGRRIELVSGDFFVAIPPNCNLYLLRSIIHDWNDEQCIQILTNIKKSLLEKGKIVVIEKILPDDKDYHLTRLLDLQVLILTGAGKERTFKELERLFIGAGLKIDKKIPLPTLDFVLELSPI